MKKYLTEGVYIFLDPKRHVQIPEQKLRKIPVRIYEYTAKINSYFPPKKLTHP